MSGIYIPGMEMPKTGRYFVSVDNTGGKDKTVIAVFSEFERKNKTRPLLAVHEIIPVPDHRRTIDGDALGEMLEKYKKEYALKAKEDIVHLHKAWGLYEAELMAESLPTIIPADLPVMYYPQVDGITPTIIPASGGDAE